MFCDDERSNFSHQINIFAKVFISGEIKSKKSSALAFYGCFAKSNFAQMENSDLFKVLPIDNDIHSMTQAWSAHLSEYMLTY